MLAISPSGALAAVPLLPAKTQSTPISIQFPTPSAPLTFTPPSCFNDAVKTAKHSFDWFADLDAAETTTAAESGESAAAAPVNLPQQRAIVEKKANTFSLIRGMAWSNSGTHLAVALDSYIFLLYAVSAPAPGDATAAPMVDLVAVIGFPRHMGMITMTPNGKNWIVVDALGDLYGFSHAKVCAGDQTQVQTLLYSVGTLCNSLQALVVPQSGPAAVAAAAAAAAAGDTTVTTTTTTTKDYLVTADSESKIRVSNLPNFFDIESFCMGSQAPPTGLVQLQLQAGSARAPSGFIVTTTPGGYVRERISDPESGFLPYVPTQASVLVHHIQSGTVILEPFRITNSDIWPAEAVTQYSSAAFFGLGVIHSGTRPNTAVCYASPALASCKIDTRGHLDASSPSCLRTTLAQLVAIEITLPESITTAEFLPAAPTLNATTPVPVVTRGVTVSKLPSWFNLERDLVHQVHSTPNQDTFVVQTITNKIIILGPDGDNDGNYDVSKLSVRDAFDFSATVMEPNPEDPAAPATILPTAAQFVDRYDAVNFSVAKYINFHWRFERAPNRQAAQRRQHLAQALRGGEDVPGDLDDEADPNQLVQLGTDMQ